MFRSTTTHKPPEIHHPKPHHSTNLNMEGSSLTEDPQVRLALYIAMAHASVAFAIFVLYGISKLLDVYFRPLLWAVICSIPLRNIHHTLVSFWTEPLKSGLTDTAIAVPNFMFRAFIGTIVEIKDLISKILGHKTRKFNPPRRKRSGFSVLLRRLVSLWVFVMAYEQFGGIGAFTLLALGFGFMFNSSNVGCTISSFKSYSFKRTPHTAFLTRGILKNLSTIVVIGLIMGMIYSL